MGVSDEERKRIKHQFSSLKDINDLNATTKRRLADAILSSATGYFQDRAKALGVKAMAPQFDDVRLPKNEDTARLYQLAAEDMPQYTAFFIQFVSIFYPGYL